METAKKEDLRARRTKTFIRKAFEEMICEMDYEKISIKELTERANINEKHFICIITLWMTFFWNYKMNWHSHLLNAQNI